MSSITFLSVTLLLLASASQSQQYCPSIEPPENGFVKTDVYHRYYEFSCEGGYMLQGHSFINCNAYDREKPRCIKHECENLANPQNGEVDCDEGPLVPGKTCRFSCFKGYRLQGSSTAVCKFNLQWSRSAECIPISRTSASSRVMCANPSQPENGKTECQEGDLTLGKVCRFSCLEGYKLQGAAVRRCMGDNRWSGSVKCVSLSEYSSPELANDNERFHEGTKMSNPDHLTNNHDLLSEVNSDPCQNLFCQHLCLIEKGRHRCKCCAGYMLNDDKRTCRLNNPQRVNMNACLHQYKKVGDVELRSCPKAYIFDYERNSCIESSPQLPSTSSSPTYFESCSLRNGGCQHQCTMTASQAITCSCRNGYELDTDGKRCIDINECSLDNFGCSHLCVNLKGSAYCVCPNGFKLDTDGKTCIDVDECLNENLCQHYCNNIPGSYVCSCKPTYILIEGHKCEGCIKNSYWSHEKNVCVDCPKNSHTDSEGKTSIKDCVCNSGYTGSPGDYITCEDINECSVNKFGCSDECVNLPGSAYCICPKGFMLDTNNKTCIDIDECSIKNGGCEGLCINTNGSFNCICPEGFIQSNKDRYSCDDIDECAENNGGCEHECMNYRGGFFCTCNDGYHLDSTLKKCTDVQCPKLPSPRYSHTECKYRNTVLPEETLNYPAGTLCTFKCRKGFKNTQDYNKMKCKKDGSWIGTFPECIAQTCPPLKVPENGEIHPRSCSTHGATVQQKCAFSCHAGYILEGFPVFNCKNNLKWSKEEIPVCEPVKVQPVIKCPDDIKVILSRGKSTHNITVPEPVTNKGSYEVHPSWITINESTEFPVGATQISFTTNSRFNETAECRMTVTVLDEEPPVFHSCPDPIIIEGAKGSGEFVTWEEPVVTDNVKLESVFSLLEPNITLAPGTYFVEYVAKDSSGNIGTCSFTISIIRMNCSDLMDPAHGKANCMDWMFGKLCNPECDDGYMQNPEDPLYYSCDDTGLWEPNDSISECLKYILATSSTCPDGFELKKVDATGGEVCIECPSNAVWSSITKTCVK